MRVGLVCPYSMSVPGGVQTQVRGLARALDADGHDVTVLAPLDGSGPSLANGVEFVKLGHSLGVRANGSVAPVSLSPLGARHALSALRPSVVDVVHLHEPFAPLPNYACLALCRTPMVGTFHRAGGSAFYTVLGPFARAAARRLALRSAVSEDAADTARHALGGNYEIVGNGVDVERIADAEPWPTNGPTVLFVGRHEERKGLQVLLEAWSRAAVHPGPNATLWVAGQGPQTAELRNRFNNGPTPERPIEWLGAIEDVDLARRLRGSDIFCAPSIRGESFGVVLLEAMAGRAAVVASNLPGYSRVLGAHGILVPPRDAGTLADTLADALVDASSGTGTSAPATLDAAAAYVSQWSMPTTAARYVDLYRRAANSRAAG